jgi:hypothetical protein
MEEEAAPEVSRFDNPEYGSWEWFFKPAGKSPAQIEQDYGAVSPTGLKERDLNTTVGAGGSETKVVTKIPDGFLVGSQGAGPCVIAVVLSLGFYQETSW